MPSRGREGSRDPEVSSRRPRMMDRARDVVRDELLEFWSKAYAGTEPWRRPALEQLAQFTVYLRGRIQDWTALEATADETSIVLHRMIPRLESWMRILDEAVELRPRERESPPRPPREREERVLGEGRERLPAGAIARSASRTWPSEDEAIERARYRRRGWDR